MSDACEQGVIDFHIHVPDQLSLTRDFDSRKIAQRLTRDLLEAGVRRAVLIAIEVVPDLFRKKITPSRIRRAVEEVVAEGFYVLPKPLNRLIEDPDAVIKEHIYILERANTPSEFVIEVAREAKGLLLPVASIPLSVVKADEAVARLEKLIRMGAIGLKILPTIQFIEQKHLRILDYVAEFLETKNKLLIIHTGCDPGIWELPFFCTSANPRVFEDIARKHKDLTIVLAHSGSYSALRPGIFAYEAITLIKRYDNVYGDTAALDYDTIEYLVRRTGAEKILFGSDYPVVVGRSIADCIRDILRLPIPISDKRKILYENAEGLLATLHC